MEKKEKLYWSKDDEQDYLDSLNRTGPWVDETRSPNPFWSFQFNHIKQEVMISKESGRWCMNKESLQAVKKDMKLHKKYKAD
jgi:hypothetical protein